MESGNRNVALSKEQCRNIAEFIEMYLIDAIRQDEAIDNVEWIESMIDAMKTLNREGRG